MADRRHYIPGCSPAALDAAGRRHYLALVRLRLGDPVAFATLHVGADDYRPMDRGRGFPFAAYTGFELKGHQAALAACNYWRTLDCGGERRETAKRLSVVGASGSIGPQ